MSLCCFDVLWNGDKNHNVTSSHSERFYFLFVYLHISPLSLMVKIIWLHLPSETEQHCAREEVQSVTQVRQLGNSIPTLHFFVIVKHIRKFLLCKHDKQEEIERTEGRIYEESLVALQHWYGKILNKLSIKLCGSRKFHLARVVRALYWKLTEKEWSWAFVCWKKCSDTFFFVLCALGLVTMKTENLTGPA